MTLTERLIMQGVKAQRAMSQRPLTVGSTGTVVWADDEISEMIALDGLLGPDPRESTYFHFLRPAPELTIGETLIDGSTTWKVLDNREDNPLKPTVRYKVEKVIA